MKLALYFLFILTLVFNKSFAQITVEEQGEVRTSEVEMFLTNGSKALVYSNSRCGYWCENMTSKKVDLVLSLKPEQIYFKKENSSFTSAVKVKIVAFNCTGIILKEWQRDLEINEIKPQSSVRIPVNENVYSDVAYFQVITTQFITSIGAWITPKLEAYYERVPLFVSSQDNPKDLSTSIQNLNPATNSSYEVILDWSNSCGNDYNNFQVQLLRIYNQDKNKKNVNNISVTNLDWSKALSIETQSRETQLKLNITEGTGFYVWRVRGIGNEFPNGVGDSRNWGTFSGGATALSFSATSQSTSQTNIGSNSAVFYFVQPNENINWIHSRVFTEANHNVDESVKQHESMTFANGLQQVKQTQTKLSSQDNVITSATVHDFSGRPGIQTLPVPKTNNPNHFGYDADFIDYTAQHFDNSSSSQNTISGGAFNYYSENDSPIANLPSAEGYPFTRTTYYKDGSSRVKEQSGVGATHRIGNGKTQKISYSSASDDELLRIFGAEAPSESSVHKVITTDPNGIASIAYINKEGQTIATCLAVNGTEVSSNLLPLETHDKANFNIVKKINPLLSSSKYVSERNGDFYVTEPTTVSINYTITPKSIMSECGNLCVNCDYFLDIFLMNADVNSLIPVNGYEKFSTKLQGDCLTSTNTQMFNLTAAVESGHYVIVQQLRIGGQSKLDNSVDKKGEDYIKDLLNYYRNKLDDDIAARLNTLIEKLSDDISLDEFYTFLIGQNSWGVKLNGDNIPFGATLESLNLNDGVDKFSIPLGGNPENCFVIELPYSKCFFYCPDSVQPYVDYITQEFVEEILILREQTPIYQEDVDNLLQQEIFAYEYYPDKVGSYFNTYGENEFYKLINNMVADGYTHCQMWDCWTRAVQSFRNAENISDDDFNASLPSQELTEFDRKIYVVNEFLKCTGYKYDIEDYNFTDKVYKPYNDYAGPGKDVFNNLLMFAYKRQHIPIEYQSPYNVHPCVNIYAQTRINSYENYYWNTWPNASGQYTPPLNLDPVGNFGLRGMLKNYESDDLPTQDELYTMFVGCVQSYEKSYENTTDIKTILELTVANCQSTCEQNRPLFEKEIIIAFIKQQGGSVMIDYDSRAETGPVTQISISDRLKRFRTYSLDTIDGIEVLKELTILKSYAVANNEIQCMLNAMINDCKKDCSRDDIDAALASVSTNYYGEIDALLPKLREQMLWLALGELDVYLNTNSETCSNDSDMNNYSKCHQVIPSAFNPPDGLQPRLIPIDPSPLECYSSFCYCWKDPCEYRREDMLNRLKIAYVRNEYTIDGKSYTYTESEDGHILTQNIEETPHINPNFDISLDQLQCEIDALMQKCYTDFNISNDGKRIGKDYITQLERLIFSDIKIGLPSIENETLCDKPLPSFTDAGGNVIEVEPFDPLTKCEVIQEGLIFKDLIDNLNISLDEFYNNFNNNYSKSGSITTVGDQSSLENLGWYVGDGSIVSNNGLNQPLYLYKSLFGTEDCGLFLRLEMSQQGGANGEYTYFSFQIIFDKLLFSSTLPSRIKDDYYSDGSGAFLHPTSVLYYFYFSNSALAFSDTQSSLGVFSINQLDYTIDFSINPSYSGGETYEIELFTNFNKNALDEYMKSQPCYDQCSINLCVCYDGLRKPIVTTTGADTNVGNLKDCDEVGKDKLLSSLYAQLETQFDKKLETFEKTYIDGCVGSENIEDRLTIRYRTGLHHYTLYYYDRAGNLVRTVPPAGVDTLRMTDYQGANGTKLRTKLPQHNLVTNYVYNSIGQLERQHTPDGGTTRFIYDNLGRLRASQNEEQKKYDGFSYTKYDNLSRVIEVGEFTTNKKLFLEENPFNVNDPLQPIETGPSGPVQPGDPIPLVVSLTDEIKTIYTTPFISMPEPYQNLTQRFTRNRISYVHNGNSPLGQNPTTIYSYDPHGNVEWLIQYVPELGAKLIEYDYDLISGNVLQVSYQKGKPDQFYHRYFYDADERITRVETSSNGFVWDEDANYKYYPHGALQRTELGNDKIQGNDYTYTIHGWLKAINHPSGIAINDPSQDGAKISRPFAPDVFGMQLDYYAGDFKSKSGSFVKYSPNISNVPPSVITTADGGTIGTGQDLFNGNISAWQFRTQRAKYETVVVPEETQAYTYRYDQLNRIKGADYYIEDEDNSFIDGAYSTHYTFDANGNLLRLNRKGLINSDGTVIDNFTYNYGLTAGTNSGYTRKTNKLNYVDDIVGADVYFNDIDDQADGNYQYNAIGELTKDNAEYISSIQWNVYHKVSRITKEANGEEPKQVIDFTYNPMLHRTSKKITTYLPGTTTIDNNKSYTLYYVNDAQGNPMATYRKQLSTAEDGSQIDALALIEENIYGTERIGMRSVNIPVEVTNDGCKEPSGVTTVSENKHVTTSVQEDSKIKQTVVLTLDNGRKIIFSVSVNGAYNLELSPDNTSGKFVDFKTISAKAGVNRFVAEDKFGEVLFRYHVVREKGTTSQNIPMLTYEENGIQKYVLNSATIVNSAWNGSSSILHYGNNNYVLFTTNTSNQLDAYKLSKNSDGEWSVTTKLTVPNNTNIRLSSLAGVEDNTNTIGTHVYAVQGTNVVKYLINTNGQISQSVMYSIPATNSYYDAIVQVSPDGKKLGVALKVTEESAANPNSTPNLQGRPATEQKGLFSIPAPRYSTLSVFNLCNYSRLELLHSIQFGDSEDVLDFDFTHDSKTIYAGLRGPKGISQRRTESIDVALGSRTTIAQDATYIRRSYQTGRMEVLVANTKTLYDLKHIFNGQYIDDPNDTLPTIDGSTTNSTYFVGRFAPHAHKLFGLNDPDAVYARTVGEKLYELKDHLGNVRAVITDEKQGVFNDQDQLTAYNATVRNDYDYYPYGMLFPNAALTPYSVTFEPEELQEEEAQMEYEDKAGNKRNSYKESLPNMTVLNIMDAPQKEGVRVLADKGTAEGKNNVMTKTFGVNQGDVLNIEAYATYEDKNPTTNGYKTAVGTAIIGAVGIVIDQVLDKTLPKAEDNKQADEKIVPLFLVLAQTINVGSSIINQTTDTITQAQAPVVSLNYEIFNKNGEVIKQGKTYMNPMFKTTPAHPKNTDHLHLDNIEMPEGATTAKVWLSRELDVEQANNLNSQDMVVYYDDYLIVNQYDPYQPFYRYGFQGQERDDEMKGKGNSLNYTYRMHDPRLGRFFAVDPKAYNFPYNSTYAFSENRVIDAIEYEGLESVKFLNGPLASPKAYNFNDVSKKAMQLIFESHGYRWDEEIYDQHAKGEFWTVFEGHNGYGYSTGTSVTKYSSLDAYYSNSSKPYAKVLAQNWVERFVAFDQGLREYENGSEFALNVANVIVGIFGVGAAKSLFNRIIALGKLTLDADDISKAAGGSSYLENIADRLAGAKGVEKLQLTKFTVDAIDLSKGTANIVSKLKEGQTVEAVWDFVNNVVTIANTDKPEIVNGESPN